MANPRVLRLDERLYHRMVNHLADTAPQEGCGLIAFDGANPVEVYPGTNILSSATRYRMADGEVLRAVEDMDRRGWWLGAIYHSHPNSPAEPSTTDLREANWPDALMLIVSFMSGQAQARAWRVEGIDYHPVEIEIIPERVRAGWLATLVRRARLAAPPPSRTPRPVSDRTWTPAPTRRPRPATASGSQGTPQAAAADAIRRALPASARRAVVGILGGMGPLATADLYRKIIEATPAGSDQEHIPVVIWADPRVPDRTEALLNGGDDPTPSLLRGGRALVSMGADFIVMPCNTAHAFLPLVQPTVDKPFVSMIDAAVDAVTRTAPSARKVGLLATSGTLSSGVYQQALQARGLSAVAPDEERQARCVMAAIRAVKAGETGESTRALLVEAAEHLKALGAEALIAGCTEIPVVVRQEHVLLPLIDATDALARAAVATARHLDAAARAGNPEWDTSPVPWVVDAAAK